MSLLESIQENKPEGMEFPLMIFYKFVRTIVTIP
jgi:hypothetical protein